MVLVDTSVWIAHFREGQPVLAELLSDGLVLMHPFVSGELACGNLKDRASILSDLRALPSAQRASDAEVMSLIENRRLWGKGTGLDRCALAGRSASLRLPLLDVGQKAWNSGR
jgi:predicted nucleic acid-binding protein